MNLELTDRILLIVGAGPIGRALARLAAQEGAVVCATSRRRESCERCRAEVDAVSTERGGVFAALDACDGDAVARLTREILDRHGKIDAAVCTVGPAAAGDALSLSRDDWEAHLRSHLFPLFEMCNAVAPIMRRQGQGAIVNLGSVSALEAGSVSQPDHGAFKLVALSWLKRLARELAPAGVRVNSVTPGIVEEVPSSLAQGLDRGCGEATSEALRRHCTEVVPLGRPARVDEIAKAVLYIASPSASYITGHNLVVDGGYLRSPLT